MDKDQRLIQRRLAVVPRGVGQFAGETTAVSASGAVIRDAGGRELIDFAGGIGVMNVGHCHPAVVEAIRRQAGELIHACIHVATYEPYVALCDPALSMVPYALLPEGAGFVIHVSRLAVHTADMLAHPAVSLLVVAAPCSTSSPQELARASVQGQARPLPPDSADHANAKARYLARFPSSEQTFSFSDFQLFAIEPRSVRFVGGFARATSILAREFVSVMQDVA
jgi:hypothetical protein